MNIKNLQKIAHTLAVEKGFWSKICPHCKGASKKWKGGTCPECFCNPLYGKKRNLSELLMLIVSELGEACEALRSGKRQHAVGFNWEKDTFEDELADAIIRICDLAESEGIDLQWQIKKKLEYNKSRPEKHGKEF